MNRLFHILSLFAVAAVTHAYVSPGLCPVFTNIKTFDIPSYLGRWYEIERLPAQFERNMECVTADYGYLSDTQITVTNSGLLLDGTVSVVEGYADATDVTGQLCVYFPDVNGNNTGCGDYNVLNTDYESFTSIYSCAQLGDLKDEFGWILSRTPLLANESYAVARTAFTTFNIDLSPMYVTYQEPDCVYSPEP